MFEATVFVEIREDGARRPLGDGFVMGGSMGEKGAFDGTVPFKPSASMGAVVLHTTSMENGHVWEAAVVRVRFALVRRPVPPAFVLTTRWRALGRRPARWLSPCSSCATSTHHLSCLLPCRSGPYPGCSVSARPSSSSPAPTRRRGGRRAGQLVLELDRDDARRRHRDYHGHAVIDFHDLRSGSSRTPARAWGCGGLALPARRDCVPVLDGLLGDLPHRG